MYILKQLFKLGLFFLIIICCYKFYKLKYQFNKIQLQVLELELKNKSLLDFQMFKQSDYLKSESEKTFFQTAQSSQFWSKLQKNLNNTVVQIFTIKDDFNILKPYKIPNKVQSSGSGFFISSDGEIITNAHVVNQSIYITIQIPAFGKQRFEVDLIGIMPEKDFALLKLKAEDLELIKTALGAVPILKLGDSDLIRRSDEILALGYPLGQESLKSTTGIVSGFEPGMIQISAAINPGNSGGPSLNMQGEVIGINFAGIREAQNVGYVIPINDLKIFLSDLRVGKLIRKPYLGIYQMPFTSKEVVQVLGNPAPGGVYITEVLNDSPLKGKLLPGDMIYSINGLDVDIYGEMRVPWSEDKITTAEYISRLKVGENITLVVYRKGEKLIFNCGFERKKLPPIRQIYPGYEAIDFEVIGGIVIMPLSLNHVVTLLPLIPKLSKYIDEKNQFSPCLIIADIIPNSLAYKNRLNIVGSIIKKVNDIEVKTLVDLQSAVAISKEFIKIETEENFFLAFLVTQVLMHEEISSREHGYEITAAIKRLTENKK